MSHRAPHLEGLTYIRDLGSGGYADVYLYQETMPRREVAVKVLRASSVSSALQLRFQQEVNAMAQLSHPNIVPVYYASVAPGGRPYLVMKYYPRASLGERARRDRLSVAETLQIGIKLASAIETAHMAGMLHRDIKPANILTDEYGEPGLGDFGIAGDIASSDDRDLGVSVPWSPPELLYATAPPGVQSDVYSLAATLWHLLVGRSPFENPGGDNSQFALMKRIRDLAPPSTGRPDVPMALDRLLRSAMAKDIALRPASALNFARSLQAIEQELTLPRTNLLLAADRPDLRMNQPVLLDDLTRVQTHQVDAQGGAGSSPGGRAAGSQSHGEDLGENTAVQRRLSLPQHGDPDGDSGRGAEGGGRSRALLGWGALIVVVVVAGIIAALLWRGPGLRQAPEPSTPVSLPPPDPNSERPPGALNIVGFREGTTVTFTWTYQHQLADDSYYWSEIGEDGPWHTTSERKIVLEDQPPGEVCVWVKVHRYSGNYALRKGTKECA
ncbi:MAG: serine/threonine-protein kinase [Propionibacteriaceae bacterium]|nr:serine/threonine-protein kinase [Propionibacteriaceae bacterium]